MGKGGAQIWWPHAEALSQRRRADKLEEENRRLKELIDRLKEPVEALLSARQALRDDDIQNFFSKKIQELPALPSDTLSPSP